ncbi:MAG: Ig-like domain-containing protein, partial [Nitrospirae bacterium]|nr:Ig-like domain-containing protein [Nitrospirota bacterium]
CSGGSLAATIGKGYTGGKNVDVAALAASDHFGTSVSLNGAGDRLAVGAWGDDAFGNTISNSGAVYLFTFTDTSFSGGSLVATIGKGYTGGKNVNISDLEANDYFGLSVSLNGVGDRLAVGAHNDDGFNNSVIDSGSVYLFSFTDTNFSGGSLQAAIGKGYTSGGSKDMDVSVLEASDYFGVSVALNGSGDRLAVGSLYDDGSGNAVSGSGAVYLFSFADANFTGGSLQSIVGKGYAGGKNVDVSVLEANDYFGKSVALNNNGDRLAVGAYTDDGPTNAFTSSGAVYLFSFTDTNFTGGSLRATMGKGYTGGNNVDVSALEASDRFGTSVALNGTGDRLAVGAYADNGLANAFASSGAVYLFGFTDTNFAGGSLQATIGKGYTGGKNVDVTALEASDYFGMSVALNGTGDRLAVGAYGDDGFTNAVSMSGAVYLFSFTDTSFTGGSLQATIGNGYTGGKNLDISSLASGDYFGMSVALNDNGDRLAVGAYGDDGFTDAVSMSGAVYLFSFTDTNFTGGSLQTTIGNGYTGGNNLDLSSLAANDYFGYGLAMNGNGDRLAVGAYLDDGSGNSVTDSGAVYLFTGVIESGDSVASAAYATNPGSASTITPSSITTLLNAGTAVTLQANNDITVSSAVTANNAAGNGGDLTLQAGRSIMLNANITTDSGNLNLYANDTVANGVVDAQRDAGAAVITMAGGASIDAGAGTVNIEMRDGAGKTNATTAAVSLEGITADTLSVFHAGSGSADIFINTAYNNTGTLNVKAGTLSVLGPLTQTGAIEVASGATLRKTGGFINSGTLRGAGVIDVGAGNTLTSNGAIAPGASSGDITGTLSINGDLTNGAGSVILSELEGTAAGSYDLLAVSGMATISAGSTLNVFLGSYDPPAGSTFNIMTYGAKTGTFSTVLPALSGGKTWNMAYSANDVTLSVVGPPPVSWVNPSGGNWSAGANWSTGVPPAATDNVVINLNGGTVTLDTNLTVNGFSLGAGTTLIANGTLSFNTCALGAGARIDLTQSGAGILTIAGQAYTVINSLGAAGSTTGLDLQGMNGNLAGRYALGSNIDASATSTWNWNGSIYNGFAPVGNSTTNFTGTLEGLGHIITGLTINRPAADFIGFFGYVYGAAIRNVGLENGSVSGNLDFVGGLAGYNYSGAITNSYNTGSVSGVTFVGGLAGLNRNGGTITDSYSTGSVTGSQSVGGLVGQNWLGAITNSYNTGNVIGDDYVGGLVGDSEGAISNSYNTGAVSGNYSEVGGLLGANWDGTITDSYNIGSVTGSYEVGGLVGLNYSGGTITTSHNSGSVTGYDDYVGGLVGANDAAISNSYNTGNVNGGDYYYVGGLAGYNQGDIANSYNTGSVTGSYEVGGLVGENDWSTINNSYSVGAVSGAGGYVGGLVGYSGATISNSYASGNVSGLNYLGGLVGYSDGTISDSYAIGDVTGGVESATIGGLVGINDYGTIGNSYSAGAVSGSYFVGGLAGENWGAATYSYWDIETSGTATGVGNGSATGVTGLTTAQMKVSSNFVDWDFATVWGIVEGMTYPYLRANSAVLTVNKSGIGSGTVTSSPAGIDCGLSCIASFPLSSTVTLTATPNAGSTFTGWSGGGCSGAGTCAVPMSADTTVTALFSDVPDTTPPTVLSTSPANGAINLALNGSMTIIWSESIDCLTVNITNITISSGGLSLSNCSGNQAVFTTSGQVNSTSYTVTVKTGVKDLAGNAIISDYSWSYTTAALSAYTITATASTGGSISPSGAVSVSSGANMIFTIAPNASHHITDVFVDGLTQGEISSYTFTNVTADHTISASFALNTYTITAAAGAGGIITPSGNIAVQFGSAKTLTIAPNGGYHVTNVLVDGVSQGAISSYTFTNVTADHTISASFAPNTYTITAAAGAGGVITPSGNIAVQPGSAMTFAISPNAGYHVTDVLVDGVSQGAIFSYTFTNVTADHMISGAFGSCNYTVAPLSPSPADFAAIGGQGTFSVEASDGSCAWTAASGDTLWIDTTGAGTGSGTGSYTVFSNTGAPRSASITVGGRSFIVNQASVCAYNLSSSSQAVPAEGGRFSVSVTASSAGCNWNAGASASWITVVTGGTTGDGTVAYSVSPNNGPERTETISIGGRVFTVNQASGCVFNVRPLTPDPAEYAAVGGTGTFSIATWNGLCPWNVESSGPSWLIVEGSGVGSGTSAYSVGPNPGEPRSGIISLGGQSFTVNQASGCAYMLSPRSRSVSAGGGSFSIGVAPNSPACAWTASTQAAWITQVSGSADGSGSVTYSVLPNAGPERTGIISIGGQAFTVIQESGCRFTIMPDNSSGPFPSTGGSGTVSVSASDNSCPWTAESSDQTWLVTTGTERGSGSGTYLVGPNHGEPRSAVVILGGQSFIVNQASGCAYIVSPSRQTVSAGGGSFSIGVTPNSPACAWTASTEEDWITQVAGSADGSGSVTYSVLPSAGPERTGTLSIGGQAFTVIQEPGCSYTITDDAVLAPFPSTGGPGSFSVTASDDLCPWAVESSEPSWLNAGDSGTGPGSGAYTVAPNPGEPRSAVISAGNKFFTVNQDSGCAYLFSAPERTVFAEGGSFSLGITPNSPDCAWTAVPDEPWITVVTVAVTDSYIVTYSVSPNEGLERTGIIDIGGQAFSVTQLEAETETTTVTASSGPGGEIQPNGEITAPAGAALTFYMYPDPGFVVTDVFVDGQSMGAMNALTLMDLTYDHTISVTFGR